MDVQYSSCTVKCLLRPGLHAPAAMGLDADVEIAHPNDETTNGGREAAQMTGKDGGME